MLCKLQISILVSCLPGGWIRIIWYQISQALHSCIGCGVEAGGDLRVCHLFAGGKIVMGNKGTQEGKPCILDSILHHCIWCTRSSWCIRKFNVWETPFPRVIGPEDILGDTIGPERFPGKDIWLRRRRWWWRRRRITYRIKHNDRLCPIWSLPKIPVQIRIWWTSHLIRSS